MHIEEVIKQSKFNSEYQKAAINMMHTMNTLNSQKQVVFDQHGISEHQFNVMRILRGALPSTLGINEIRSRMVDKSSDTSRIIDRMVAKKLVERTRSEKDRRNVEVRISDTALAILKKIDKQEENIYGGLVHLNKKEIKELNRMLEKIWNK
jgi:DNA-binding MarR family transcriptional regulator